MNCPNCGTQIPEGKYFCPSCATEIRMVPDYNEEEDMLADLVSDKTEDAKQIKAPKQKREEEKGNRKIRRSILGTMISLLFVCFLIVSLLLIQKAYEYQKERKQYNSFDFQQEEGIAAARNKNYDLAITYFTRALEIDHTSLDVRFRMADIYVLCDEYDKAVVMYEEVLSLAPESHEAYEGLITLYEEEKDFSSLFSLMRRANSEELKALFVPYLNDIPEFSLQSGVYPEEIEVELYAEHDEILYTIDGSDPSEEGLIYYEPIHIADGETIVVRAVCRNRKDIYGEEKSETYSVEISAPLMPTVYPSEGDFASWTQIYIDTPENCNAYYLWDQDAPDENSNLYNGELFLPEGNHVLSVILIDQETGKKSPVACSHYTYYEPIPEEEEVEEEVKEQIKEKEKNE